MSNLFTKLKNFRLNELLLHISTLLKDMFLAQKPFFEIDVIQKGNFYDKKGRVTFTAWQLTDLAFLAINHTNDFAKYSPTKNDIIDLMNEYHNYDGEFGSKLYENRNSDDTLLMFSIGFSQTQFWYQELYRIKAEYNRQVEILENLTRQISHKYNLDKECIKAIGFNLENTRKLLFCLYALGGKTNDLSKLNIDKNVSEKIPVLSIENLTRIITYYKATYKDIRGDALKENIFFVKPIIETTDKKLIIMNQYLIARKISDGPLWILREHFRKEYETEEFLILLGDLFELYFEKLLGYYLKPNKFRKLKSKGKNKKIADFIIEFKRWNIIIELKSPLLPLPARYKYPDPEIIKKFVDKLSEGIVQLDSTEVELNSKRKKVIKLLVHYDSLYVSDSTLRPIAVEKCIDKINDKSNIFFCDLIDFEQFLQTITEYADGIDTILNEKIELEKRIDGNALGKEFGQIIDRNYQSNYNRFLFEEINHYSNLSKKLLEPLK